LGDLVGLILKSATQAIGMLVTARFTWLKIRNLRRRHQVKSVLLCAVGDNVSRDGRGAPGVQNIIICYHDDDMY